MRDPKRIDRMIEKLRATWHASPDQRLGQLVANLCRDEAGRTRDVFNVEDDYTEKSLDWYLAEFNKALS